MEMTHHGQGVFPDIESEISHRESRSFEICQLSKAEGGKAAVAKAIPLRVRHLRPPLGWRACLRLLSYGYQTISAETHSLLSDMGKFKSETKTKKRARTRNRARTGAVAAAAARLPRRRYNFLLGLRPTWVNVQHVSISI